MLCSPQKVGHHLQVDVHRVRARRSRHRWRRPGCRPSTSHSDGSRSTSTSSSFPCGPALRAIDHVGHLGPLGTGLGALEQEQGMGQLTAALRWLQTCAFPVESGGGRWNSESHRRWGRPPVAGWLAPVAAWLCCRWPAGCPASSPGTGVFANRVSPASWTGCFFCPRFHLGAPGCPLSRSPGKWPSIGSGGSAYKPPRAPRPSKYGPGRPCG